MICLQEGRNVIPKEGNDSLHYDIRRPCERFLCPKVHGDHEGPKLALGAQIHFVSPAVASSL